MGERKAESPAGADRLIEEILDPCGMETMEGGRTRYAELRKRGIGEALAAQTAASSHGPWRIGQSPALSLAFPDVNFGQIGLFRLAWRRWLNPPNRRVRTRTHDGVTGRAGDRLPMLIIRSGRSRVAAKDLKWERWRGLRCLATG